MEFITYNILHRLKKYEFLYKNLTSKDKQSLKEWYMQDFHKFYRIEGIKNIRITKIKQDIKRRHNLINKTRFDFVNSKKAPIYRLNFNFQNNTVRRHFNSQELNFLIEHKRELKKKFTPIILKNFNNNTWPLDNPQIFKEIKNYIELSNYLISVLTAKKFIKSFSLKINNKYKILTEDSKHPEPFVNRQKLKNRNHWSEIFKKTQLTLDSLFTKLWAVELVSISNERETPRCRRFLFFNSTSNY